MSAYSNQLTPAFSTAFAQASTKAVIATGPGILRQVTVAVANATAPTDFYDLASTTITGQPIYSTTIGLAAGSAVQVDIPFTTGLTVDGTNASAGTFSIQYDTGAGV